MSKRFKADIMLLMVALFWGISYYLTDYCLLTIQPFTLNGIRFTIAFVTAFAIAPKKCASISRATLKYSVLLGALLVAIYTSCTIGLQYTSQSNASFLCGLTSVMTPIFAWIFLKRRPAKKIWLVIILAFVGVALLTLTEALKPALGDLLCLLCSMLYAVHILITSYVVQREDVDAYTLGVFQLGAAGVLNIILAFLLETPKLPTEPRTIVFVLVLALFCTGLSFIFQSIAQQHTAAENVGVLMTLEPVVAALVAYLFAGEVLLPRNYAGMALLLIAILIVEIDFTKLFKRKVENEGTENVK